MIKHSNPDYEKRRELYAHNPECDYIVHFKTGEWIWLSPEETKAQNEHLDAWDQEYAHVTAVGDEQQRGFYEDVNFDPEDDQ